MKHICVTYHMTHKTVDGRETVEGRITLPMSDDCAKDMIEKGEEGPTYLAFVHDILSGLSDLQGFNYVGFCSARSADESEADDYAPQERYRVTWCDFKGDEHETRYRNLRDAIESMRYLEGCQTQGPVKVEEIKNDAAGV